MKKILSSILLLSLGLLSTNQATADTTELTANFQSDYVMHIPLGQEITERKTNIGDLYITGDIAPTHAVEVDVATNQFERKNSSDVLGFSLMYDNSTAELESYLFNEEDIQAGNETKVDLWTNITQTDWDNAKAGEYYGSIVFTANLREG